MDGGVGTYVREQIAKTPIQTVSKVWDNGFRHITSSTREIRTPEDLKGFKIRVPPSPMLTSVFKALDAGAAPLNFNELYSALQTKIFEGQENPLAITATTRLYEVQKSCSLTGHVWDGYWILGNKRALQRLPEDLRALVTRNSTAPPTTSAPTSSSSVSPAHRTDGEGHHLHRRRPRAVPGCARQDQLLQGLESQVRRRGLGPARGRLRQAGLTQEP